MKNHFSKRILSILLSILMVVTTIPAFTLTAQAAELDRDPSLNKYIYAYFSGNSGCQIRFAVSDDGYNFEALNSGEQILQTTTDDIITFRGKTGMGNQKGARDPFIIRKPDNSGFYIVATDLDTGYSKNRSGSGNKYNNTNILVWDVPSLTSAADVKPWSIDTCGWFSDSYFGTDSDGFLGIGKTNNYFNGNGVNVSFCAWAPEVTWDAEKGMYMMYWSACMYSDLRIRYAYTNDFRTFYKADGSVLDGTTGEPDILYDNGRVSIDGNITYDKSTGKYYMYFKDEQSVREGNAASNLIRRVEADHLSGPYTNEIKIDTASVGLEGPEVYQMLDGSYVFMGDNFADGTNGGRFTFYRSETLEGLTGGSAQYFGDGLTINHLIPSHGTMSYITTEEYDALINKYGLSNFATPALDDIKTVNDHLVARYFTTGDVYEDATGHGFNLTTQSNITVESDNERSSYAEFKGNNVLASNYNQASYGVVDTAPMLNRYNFNANDGVTFSWYGNSKMTNEDGNGYAAYFSQVQAGVTPGSMTNNNDSSHFNTAHTFVTAGKPTFSVGGSGQGASVYGNENGDLDPPSLYTNGWHKFTVTYVNGFMNFYIDGKIYNTFLTEKSEIRHGSPLKVSTINDDWFRTIFGGNLYFGASLFGGDDQMLKGSISDFRIYNKALNPAEVEASETYLLQDAIGEAITNFENTLAESEGALVNYAPAYTAYIECKKALDSLTYGTYERGEAGNQINYEALITNLVEATKSLNKFTTNRLANAQVFDSNNSNSSIVPKYANKLLYYGRASGQSASLSFNHNIVGEISTNSNYGTFNMYHVSTWNKIIMSDFVMLYDGDNENLATAPVQVTFEYQNNGYTAKRRGMVSGICDNPEFSLAVWHECPDIDGGTWSKGNKSAPYIYAEKPANTLTNQLYTGTTGENASPSIRCESNKDSSSTLKWTGDSYITLNPTNITFNKDNDAHEVDTSISIYDIDNHKTTFKASGISYDKDKTEVTNAYDAKNPENNSSKHYNTNYGYIVNYVPVKEAQARAMKYIKNVKDYQLDNVNYLALLKAMDDSTSLSLVSLFDSGNVKDNADTAGHMIKTAADNIDKAIAKLEAERTKEDHYETLRNDISYAKAIINSTNTRYTDDSFAKFKEIFDDAQEFMNDVYGTNDTHSFAANNYNHNADAKAVAEALESVLNEYIDASSIRNALALKASIFNNVDEQVYTLSSWLDNLDKFRDAESQYQTISKTTMHPTEDATYVNLAGETVHYDRVLSDQYNPNNTQNVVDAVNAIELQPIDAADAYTNFDNVCAVVDAMDRAKYTDEALAEIDALYNKLNTEVVYLTPAQEVADLYQSVDGVDISRMVLKNTTTDKTDPETISLLELVNGAAVNQYKAYLSVKVENGTESAFTQYGEIKPYGDMFTIDVSDHVQEGDKVTWSATLYKKGYGEKAAAGEKVEDENILGTQKISNYTGSELQRKADCDFVVTAKITKANPSTSEKVIKIYNGYGNLVDVKYVASASDVKVNGTELTVGTETIKEPKLPFYTLTGWTVNNAGATIYVNPVYNQIDMKTITVNGGTAEGLGGDKAAVTNYVTLTADDANAYGWAVKNGDKYQIVGYGNVYSFLVVNDETYYPILKDADGNYTVDGAVLTADMVEGFQNNTANKMADNDFLKVKLDNKAPFVYNQSVNGRTHYYRITANSSESVLKAHGMHVARPDGKEANFASTTQNVGGQYSMTMKNDTVGYTFEGFITYEFKYNFKGVDYTLNTTEYTASVEV